MKITLTVVYRLRHKLTSTTCNFSKTTQYYCTKLSAIILKVCLRQACSRYEIMLIYVKMERAEIKIRLFTIFKLALNALPPYILLNQRELGNSVNNLCTKIINICGLLPDNLTKASR